MSTAPAPAIDRTNVRYNAATSSWEFDDESALKLVVDDLADTDAWMNLTQWASNWT